MRLRLRIATYPYQALTNDDIIIVEDELEDPIDPEGFKFSNNDNYDEDVVVKVKDPPIKLENIDVIVSDSSQNVPESLFDPDNLEVVSLLKELIENLDFTIKFINIFGIERLVQFDEAVFYSSEDRINLRRFVLNRKGYLLNDSNYVYVSTQRIRLPTEAIVLRNLRVILYWREINLDYVTVKRILTLGLLYLIEIISDAELLFYIRDIIPDSTFEVSILRKDKTFVRLGIEPPIFRY